MAWRTSQETRRAADKRKHYEHLGKTEQLRSLNEAAALAQLNRATQADPQQAAEIVQKFEVFRPEIVRVTAGEHGNPADLATADRQKHGIAPTELR